jgi:hypothetical protein
MLLILPQTRPFALQVPKLPVGVEDQPLAILREVFERALVTKILVGRQVEQFASPLLDHFSNLVYLMGSEVVHYFHYKASAFHFLLVRLDPVSP